VTDSIDPVVRIEVIRDDPSLRASPPDAREGDAGRDSRRRRLVTLPPSAAQLVPRGAMDDPDGYGGWCFAAAIGAGRFAPALTCERARLIDSGV